MKRLLGFLSLFLALCCHAHIYRCVPWLAQQSSSTAPPDFRTGLIVELDAQTLSGVDGTIISTWTDTSPNAFTFIANTGKGGYISNSVALLNNKHAVTFLRSLPTAYYKTNFSGITATNYTAFAVVVGFDGSNGQTEDLIHFWTVATQKLPMYYNTGQNHWGYYDSSATTFQEALGFVVSIQSKATLISWHCESPNVGNTRTNGVTSSNLTQTYTKQPLDKMTVGSYQDNSANGYNGILAIIRVYYLLSSTDQQKVERYLGYTYGITVP